MPEAKPTSNVKIYDRPERKAPPMMLMLVAALIVLMLGFVVYRFVLHPADAAQTSTTSSATGTRAAASSP